jgi:acetolactate synthase-1/2/3 large subunit
MRFDDRVTGDLKTYARQAKIIHIDIDLSEIGKNVPVDVPLAGNAKDLLQALIPLLTPTRRDAWVKAFDADEQEEILKVIQPEIHPASGPLRMGEVVRRVSEASGNKAVLVTDVGQNQMMGVRYFKYSRTRSVVSSGGLGTMGFGLPAAIGAKLGAPDRTVCCFVGDGGLQMTLQELGTIMQERIDVKIILLNNHYLGMVRQWQELFWNRRYSCTEMENPDFIAIAKAYRLGAQKVSERENLDEAIREMFAYDGGYLLEVEVEKSGMVYPMVPAGRSLNDMIVK